MGGTVYFIGTENEEKIHFLLGVSHDLVKSDLDVRPLVKTLTPLLGTGGGGRKDLVQGGGKNEGQFDQKWQDIQQACRHFLQEMPVK